MKSILPVFFILLFTKAFPQDTISVYFESNSSKIENEQFVRLHSLLFQYELNDVDSVHYIGMADSTGNFSSNLKLSKTRAKVVANYCKSFFPKSMKYTTTAMGEIFKKDKQHSRRVDLIIYSKPATEEIIEDEPEVKDTIKYCYGIDYNLLHRCNIRTITRNKKKFIQLTSYILEPYEKNNYYYASVRNGQVAIHRLKWYMYNTGRGWWAKKQYVAIIPKADYKRFKIFKKSLPPCKYCNEEFVVEGPLKKEISCLQTDRFLMRNIQVKTSIFNFRSVKVRAPKEYVDPEGDYLIGCEMTELIWETKGGRRNKNYYYTKLPIRLSYLENIMKKMECCKDTAEPSECNVGIIKCATKLPMDKALTVGIEIGDNYRQQINTPYAGVTLGKYWDFAQAILLISTDSDLGFYSALRYHFYFLSIPLWSLKPGSQWQTPEKGLSISKYGRLYAGTEMSLKMANDPDDYFQQNVHLGICVVNAKEKAIFQRIFVQGGLALNYNTGFNSGVYPVVQGGINIRCFRFKTHELMYNDY